MLNAVITHSETLPQWHATFELTWSSHSWYDDIIKCLLSHHITSIAFTARTDRTNITFEVPYCSPFRPKILKTLNNLSMTSGPCLHFSLLNCKKYRTLDCVIKRRNWTSRNTWLMITIDHNLLTHWGWDKMAAIFQTTFSNVFSWMKMFEFRLKFHWSLFLRVQLTISQQ